MGMNVMKKIILTLLIAMPLWACQSEDEQAGESEALCECVKGKKPNGEWDLQLSEACIQMCIETFGPELKGMETWFQENCDLDLQHPKVDKKEEEEVRI